MLCEHTAELLVLIKCFTICLSILTFIFKILMCNSWLIGAEFSRCRFIFLTLKPHRLRKPIFVCVLKSPFPIIDASPVLSFISGLSWRLRRRAGGSTSIFQQILVTIYRRCIPPVSGRSDKAHIKRLCHLFFFFFFQLYSLYNFMYIHMYTVKKSVALQM